MTEGFQNVIHCGKYIYIGKYIDKGLIWWSLISNWLANGEEQAFISHLVLFLVWMISAFSLSVLAV